MPGRWEVQPSRGEDAHDSTGSELVDLIGVRVGYVKIASRIERDPTWRSQTRRRKDASTTATGWEFIDRAVIVVRYEEIAV